MCGREQEEAERLLAEHKDFALKVARWECGQHLPDLSKSPEDICHDVLMKFFKTIRAGKVLENPEAYIRRSIKHAVRDLRKSKSPNLRTVPADEMLLPSLATNPEKTTSDRDEVTRIYRKIVEVLPLKQRYSLEVAIQSNTTAEEFAAADGQGKGAVYARNSRSRDKLDSALEAEANRAKFLRNQ